MDKKTVVACVGDSITWGFLIKNRSRNNYPAVLQSLLGDSYDVVGCGRNSATALKVSELPYVITRAYRRSHRCNPDIVVFMLGSNDSKSMHWNEERFKADYKSLVEEYLALPSKPRVILMLPPRVIYPVITIGPFALRDEVITESILPAIRAVADEKGLELIDLNSLICRQEQFVDGIHPTAGGARTIAEAVARQILR